MLADSKAYSGIAVNDLEKAKEFYGETLGLKLSVLDERFGLMTLHLAGERDTLVYHSPDVTPASYTILNFPVDDIDEVVDGLTARGVRFERYDNLGFEQDEKGIARGREASMGPDIAWFKDPAGNILSVLQN
jgi:catechol 2,3-dioxygenase-like lactoylglutathione lyase family enzyme